ncbi:MAG: cytochrome c oxidase cbb3-type subunit 4 [Gammaproteobacteria bacterium]|jgi:cytochrome c oxidase cbb3-type subunit 4
MDFLMIQSIWSIVILVTFIGIIVWAYSDTQKERFKEAENFPFDDEPATPQKSAGKE